MERKFERGKIVACIPFPFLSCLTFDIWKYLSILVLFIYFFFHSIVFKEYYVSWIRVGYDDPYIYIYVYHVYIVSIYRAKNIKQISIFPIRKKLRDNKRLIYIKFKIDIYI